MTDLLLKPVRFKQKLCRSIRTIATVTLSIGVIACGGTDGGSATPNGPEIPPSTSAQSDGDYADVLTAVKDEFGLPAVAGMLIYNDEVKFNGAAGLRTVADKAVVTESDLWHLGSISKSMTATLAGRLVEQGLIDWHTTIEEIYPELVKQGNGQFDHVTLEQLLSHHSGLQRNLDWTAYLGSEQEITEQRRNVVAKALNTSPNNHTNAFYYSNLGFVIAGAMLETVTGSAWETLITEQLFTPLEIFDGGFGAPGDGVSQPSGHLVRGSSYEPVLPTSNHADNPAVIGPAGTIHMSLASLAKYARAHMIGELGESTLLSSTTFSRLHQPVSGSDYALGWFVQPNALFHDGSNNLWFAKLSISRQHQIIIISLTNAGGQKANKATDEITNRFSSIFFNG